jgi:hypothetical protein
MTLNEIQAAARTLGLTETEVKSYGPLNKKATWETAIDHARTLAAEAEAENQAAQAAQAYSSPSAAMVVPAAAFTAVGVTLIRSLAGTAELIAKKTRR